MAQFCRETHSKEALTTFQMYQFNGNWARLPADTRRPSHGSWEKRCRMGHKLSGEPIEHPKMFHRMKV